MQFCPRRRGRRAQHGPPTPARPAATTFAPEVTRLFATATPGLLASTGQLAPPCHSIDQTSLWIENAALNNWMTQQLGGTWPNRAPVSTIGQDATIWPRTLSGRINTPQLAVKENVPAVESLVFEVLSPQARDALTVLSRKEVGALALDSDDMLGVLNARPIPEMCLPQSTILTEGERTVAWESLLSPRAQEALTVLAQQTDTAVVDSDALLAILNGTEEFSQDVEEFPRDIPCVEDSWMAGLLSPEAQAGLTAVAAGERPIEDSDELLGILNSVVELNHVEESGMGVGLRALGQEAPEDIAGAGDSWMAGLLSPKARAGLTALAWHNGMVEDADELLDVLNGRSVFYLTVEKDAEDSQEVLVSGEAHERNEGQQATFDEVLAELHAQLGKNDQRSEEDSDSEEPYTFWGSLFERTESVMSVTSEAPSLVGLHTASKTLRPPPSYYGTWTDDSDEDFR
ncbi:hypothetical protein FB451DRAFT_1231905 [Mycena latifolia]|nr:hypothetical protein FB451DRAFT_1231905 [Mycena latifolia]